MAMIILVKKKKSTVDLQHGLSLSYEAKQSFGSSLVYFVIYAKAPGRSGKLETDRGERDKARKEAGRMLQKRWWKRYDPEHSDPPEEPGAALSC